MFNLYWNLVGGTCTFCYGGHDKEEPDNMTTLTRIVCQGNYHLTLKKKGGGGLRFIAKIKAKKKSNNKKINK